MYEKAALEKLALPAEAALLIGGTPYDVQAAAPLELGVVALRCGGWNDEELAGATSIYDDPQDLPENYEISPFARNV